MINIDGMIGRLVDYFKSDDRILSVYLIGSYGTEFQREESDIDFAFLFEGDMDFIDETKIACDISRILKFDDIDVVNLKKAPITLQLQAVNEGRQIYEKDFVKVCDYAEYVYKRYRDEKYFIDNFYNDYFYNFKN